MYEIKNIKIWPFARTLALMVGLVALVGSIVIPLAFGFIEDVLFGYDTAGEFLFDFLRQPEYLVLMAGIFLVSVIIALAAGALGAWIYNIVSYRLGGIKMDIDFLGGENSQKKQ